MFDKSEINVLLAALNGLQIKGSDAAYIYSIQIKLNKELEKIKEEELKREEELKLGPPELRDNKIEQNPTKKS
tara:strand:+ start:467 stop:685 length:219 start_codon:yes stop_codon:yes gene_type:complete